MGRKYIHQWVIYSQQWGTCVETGLEIKPMDVILYIPPGRGQKTGSAFHSSSDAMKAATASPGIVHTGFKIEEKDQKDLGV